MPTQVYDVTATPVDVLTANALDGTPLLLLAGKSYSARYEATLGAATVMRAIESTAGSPPNADDIGLPVLPFEDLIINPIAGLAVYCWEETGAGVLIINDVG